jgi:hypothetical protein
VANEIPSQATNIDQWRTEHATPVRTNTVLKLWRWFASVLHAPLDRVTTGAPHKSLSKAEKLKQMERTHHQTS